LPLNGRFSHAARPEWDCSRARWTSSRDEHPADDVVAPIVPRARSGPWVRSLVTPRPPPAHPLAVPMHRSGGTEDYFRRDVHIRSDVPSRHSCSGGIDVSTLAARDLRRMSALRRRNVARACPLPLRRLWMARFLLRLSARHSAPTRAPRERVAFHRRHRIRPLTAAHRVGNG